VLVLVQTVLKECHPAQRYADAIASTFYCLNGVRFDERLCVRDCILQLRVLDTRGRVLQSGSGGLRLPVGSYLEISAWPLYGYSTPSDKYGTSFKVVALLAFLYPLNWHYKDRKFVIKIPEN
jgi:hypothetical protein